MLIEFQQVSKAFTMGDHQVHALREVDLTIDSGELVAIVGPSGSGKTSAMNILGLLDHPTTGAYYLKGKAVKQYAHNELATLRNQHIGFVFQSFFLLPKLTAMQNVGLPLHYRGVSPREIQRRAMAILADLGMESYATHRPSELSGGQQQRVAIARALVGEPSIILADEPTGALDSQTSQQVMELLLHHARTTTVIIITHDPDVAARCRRVIHLRDGSIQVERSE